MGKTLFVEHMENVGWRVLRDYPKATRDLIRGRHGVYALFHREKLYYVGLASSLMGRVKGHLKNRHTKAWDRFSVYLTATAEHMRELEALLVRIARPPGNRQTGRLRAARDLRKRLNRDIREHDDSKRALILGGDVAKARRERKARRGGRAALAGAVERTAQLRAEFKGKTFRARLRRDGRIRFNGRLYTSPTAAAKAAAKGPRNGWYFWKIRFSKHGPWQRLLSLKK